MKGFLAVMFLISGILCIIGTVGSVEHETMTYYESLVGVILGLGLCFTGVAFGIRAGQNG